MTSVFVAREPSAGLGYLMNPEHAPPLRQSEITSRAHALETSETSIQRDPFNPSHSNVPRMTDTGNLSPYVLSESPSHEKLEVSEISSLQHIRVNDHLRSLYKHLYLFYFPNQKEKVE